MFAEDAAIQSANIVGYQTVHCAANSWYMLANQFQDIGTGGDVNLQKFVTSKDLTPFDTEYGSYEADIDTGAQIQVWNPDDNDGLGGYVVYWYLAGALNYDKDIWDDVPNVWSSGYSIYDPDAMVRHGDSVWFRSPWAADITVAGQVVAADTKPVVTKKDQWYLIANPYPMSLKLNGGKIDWETCGLTAFDTEYGSFEADIDTGAQIQYWNPELYKGQGGYDVYWYLAGALNYDKDIWDDVPNVWSAGYSVYDPDATIPAGQGFWFRQPFGTITLTFEK